MRKRRSRRANVMVPLASMGDIAFLLIAFFVLASQFTKNVGVKYEQADSKDIDLIEKIPDINIIVDEKLDIYFDNNRLGSIDELEGRIAAAVATREGEGRRVILRCDENTHSDIYMGIIEACANAGVPIAMSGDEDKENKGG